MIKFLPVEFLAGLNTQNSTKDLKPRLPFANICIGSGDIQVC